MANKKRYQKALLWDEDHTIKPRRLTIETGVINDDKNGQTWHHLDRFLVYFPQMACTIALLSPRTEIPLSPFNKLTKKEEDKIRNISSIAEENLEHRDIDVQKDNKRNRNAQMIQIAMIFVCITFLLVMTMKGCGGAMEGYKDYLPGLTF